MKKMMIFTIVAAVAFSAASCKRAGDVLATYNGGTITRGEFYDWMDARRMAKDAILKKKQQQKTHLERFAVERFVVREAVKAGFDKKEDFQFLRKLATRNFYSQYLGRQMSSEGSFSEKAVKASIIKFAVKNFKIVQNRREKLTPAELETALKEKEDKARTVIRSLTAAWRSMRQRRNTPMIFPRERAATSGSFSRGCAARIFRRQCLP